MLLSVFSFSPSASGDPEMAAETTKDASGALGTEDQTFAKLVQSHYSPGEQQNSELQRGLQYAGNDLDQVLKQFSSTLRSETQLTAEQLEGMVASVDAVLLQISAASYPAPLTEALENISVHLKQLTQQLATGSTQGQATSTIAFAEVIEAILVQSPESDYAATLDATYDNDNQVNVSGWIEDESILSVNLFSDLQSSFAVTDSAISEPLNVLLALYQTPAIYQQALQPVPSDAADTSQFIPQWVRYAHALQDGPAGDVPDITLPGQSVSAGRAEADINISEDTGQATRGENELIEAKLVNKAESLMPLSQFAQALQADATTPVTQGAFAPVVEAQSVATNARYNADAEIHVPRGIVSDQVQVALKHANAEGLQRITIQLDPHELGRIDVRMDADHNGAMRIAFTADRPETLDMLQREARVLERLLQDSGMKTDTGNMEFHLRQQPNQQHAGGQFQDGQREGHQNGADTETGTEHTIDTESKHADGLAALGATEHVTHDVHYGVNVQV